MNLKELAKSEGVSTTTIANWVRNGCPAPKSKTGAYRFNLKAVRRWRAENLGRRPGRGDTLMDARKRKEFALAGLRELELRTRNDELVERVKVKSKLRELQKRTMDALKNIPARLSGVLAAESNQDVIFEMLTKEIYDLQVELGGENDDKNTKPE